MQSVRDLVLQVVIVCAYPTLWAAAQEGQARSPGIITRKLGSITAVSTESIGALAGIRELPNGSVLVNDQKARRLLLLDRTLKLSAIIADGTLETHKSYGMYPAGLIPFHADSTLLVDPASMSVLVIDPSGKVSRIMAVPRPKDASFMVGGYGDPGFDNRGRLVYRNVSPDVRIGPAAELQAGNGTGRAPDMAPIVRLDINAHQMDTVTYVKVAQNRAIPYLDADGRKRMRTVINPMPTVDEWAVLSDGTIAIVRGADYHVDLIGADNSKTVGPKIPFNWQRFKDDLDKQRVLDSARIEIDSRRKASTGTVGASLGSDGARPGTSTGFSVDVIEPTEMADYRPAFGAFSVHADLDSHLWIRTLPTNEPSAGVIYDVIDKRGVLVDRVLVPSSMAIVGFGRRGIVFLGARQGTDLYLWRANSK
ncbi:MAG: hypothetical protein JWM95_3617 [Gemmatimonadetes bacterium]|nr:hypothetical protein [Gemmatimonadota bacterium]